MNYVTDREQRRTLADFCRDAGCRVVGHWRQQQPSNWHPGSVRRPDGQGFFTDAGAFEFIAALIDDHNAIKIVEMEIPAGTEGYEIVVRIEDGRPDLYIKLTLRKDKMGVIGRSFHYSNR